MAEYNLYSRQFVGLLFANMFFWMSTNFFLPVLPLFYHAQGMPDQEIGLAVGAFSLGAILLRIFAGKAVDRYGSVPVITVGIIVSMIAIGCYAFSTTFPTAAAARFIHGMGISSYGSAALTMATMLHGEQYAADALAMYTLFTMLGNGIATSSAKWLYDVGGIWAAVAFGGTATFLSLALFPKHPRLAIKPQKQEALPLRQVVSNQGVLIPTISVLAVNICFGTTMTFLPLLITSRGLPGYGAFYVAYAVAVIVSRFWVSRLCTLLSPEKLSWYLLLLNGLTMFVIAQAGGVGALLLAGTGIGIGYGLAFPTMATIVTAHTQAANRGTAFGFFTMAVDGGVAIGAIAMGYVAAWQGYTMVYWVAGLYTVLYALVYRFWLYGALHHLEHVSVSPAHR